MAHFGYGGVPREGCGGLVRGPILGPFGPDAGFCLSEPILVFRRTFPNGNGNA
jgi:hypothetical protein